MLGLSRHVAAQQFLNPHLSDLQAHISAATHLLFTLDCGV
jgi:hypothetical protein